MSTGGVMYFNRHEIIKEIIAFGSHSNKIESVKHIAYGTDARFLVGCKISISSILQQNKEHDFCFHIFTDSIDKNDLIKIKEMVETSSTVIKIYFIKTDKLENLPKNKLWSIAIYYRLLIADFFYGEVNRILYLDSDIICKGDISELFSLNINNNYVAAVAERNNEWWAKRSHDLGVSKIKDGYFNSGVLVININEWKKGDITGKAILTLNNIKDFKGIIYYDQDVLNILTAGSVVFIDKIFNTQYSLNYELKTESVCPINENTRLIHYIGPCKPWHSWVAMYDAAQFYRDAKEVSVWENDRYISPKNSMQYRYAAKHNFHQNKYVHADYCLIKQSLPE